MDQDSSEGSASGRRALLARIVQGHERLMQRLSVIHAADFVAIGISMPQAKTLYLVAAAGEIHMSELAARLGVTLSTVSGLVERLVEAGFVARHDDPADRRQVVVTATDAGSSLMERFRELNDRELDALLGLLSDPDLATVAAALEALERAAAHHPGTAPGSDCPPRSSSAPEVRP